MIRWSFEDEKLLELVICEKKKATSSIYNGKDVPKIGEKNIITQDNIDRCKIKITGYKIFKFKEAKEEDIIQEGEGNLEEWKRIHTDFFKKYYNDFNEDSNIIIEYFELLEVFKLE